MTFFNDEYLLVKDNCMGFDKCGKCVPTCPYGVLTPSGPNLSKTKLCATTCKEEHPVNRPCHIRCKEAFTEQNQAGEYAIKAHEA